MFFPPCSKSFRASSEGRRKPILPDTQARRLATPIRPSALPSRAPQPDWPGAFVTLNGSSSFPSRVPRPGRRGLPAASPPPPSALHSQRTWGLAIVVLFKASVSRPRPGPRHPVFGTNSIYQTKSTSVVCSHFPRCLLIITSTRGGRGQVPRVPSTRRVVPTRSRVAESVPEDSESLRLVPVGR